MGKNVFTLDLKNQTDDVSSFFEEIEERYQSKNYNHIVGVIDIEKLKQKEIIENTNLSIIAFE
ncbi:hypothetical protein OBJ97_01970 [Empedobacter falsenii]